MIVEKEDRDDGGEDGLKINIRSGYAGTEYLYAANVQRIREVGAEDHDGNQSHDLLQVHAGSM